MVIIAAVDKSERAEKVIREAMNISESTDQDVHAVHVLSSSEFVGLEVNRTRETGRGVDLDEVKDKAKEIAQSKASQINGEIISVGLMGDAADEIIEYSIEKDADYIVVGPRRRSPAGKAIFGSVAQSILLNSECPVICVP